MEHSANPLPNFDLFPPTSDVEQQRFLVRGERVVHPTGEGSVVQVHLQVVNRQSVIRLLAGLQLDA